jgi:23S rRNA U2552 (ribose-2'-O)-methylase RlmE/FtsJ
MSKLCINCPPEKQVPATRKYNQLKPMCEKHFGKVMAIVRAFCGPRTRQELREGYKLGKVDMNNSDVAERLDEWKKLSTLTGIRAED